MQTQVFEHLALAQFIEKNQLENWCQARNGQWLPNWFNLNFLSKLMKHVNVHVHANALHATFLETAGAGSPYSV